MICLKPSSWLASQKVDKNVQLHGRSPYGERGLKFRFQRIEQQLLGRSPYGERGLKLYGKRRHPRGVASRSPYGGRGLKYFRGEASSRWCTSLSLRRAWIEISPVGERGHSPRSLSLRRAWIEISLLDGDVYRIPVALLTESVD